MSIWRQLVRRAATFVVLAGGVAVLAQAPPRLSLAQAVAEALRASPRLQAAAAGRDQARAAVAAARAGYWPTVDAAGNFVRSDNPVTVFGTLLSQQSFTAAALALPVLNQPAPLNNFQTQISVRVPLFDARQTALREQEAKLGVSRAGAATEQARQGVIVATVSAYYGLAASQAALQVANSAVAAAKSGRDMAEQRYQAGMTVNADRLSAEVYLAQAREREAAARNQVNVAAAALNRELGRPLPEPVAIAASADEVARVTPQSPLAPLAAQARRQRPELLGQRDEVAIAGREVVRTRDAFLPTLDGFASWEADQRRLAQNGGRNWTLGLSLHLNLFRGGADRAAARAALAQQAMDQAQLRDLDAAVELQVSQAWYAVDTAARQLQLSQTAVAQADAALSTAQTRYRSGLTTITDLLRTQTDATQAGSQRVQAAYDLEVSRANRDLAVGVLGAPSSAANPGGQ